MLIAHWATAYACHIAQAVSSLILPLKNLPLARDPISLCQWSRPAYLNFVRADNNFLLPPRFRVFREERQNLIDPVTHSSLMTRAAWQHNNPRIAMFGK
jgi:hypothetical protein